MWIGRVDKEMGAGERAACRNRNYTFMPAKPARSAMLVDRAQVVHALRPGGRRQ